MKKAIIIGSFGCGNKGDDAILDALNILIKEKYELIPTVGEYGGIEQIVHGEAISLRLNEGFSFAVAKSVTCFLLKYFVLLNSVDAVIIGGGSLLHDITIYNLPFYALLEFLAEMRKKPVYYIGVGAGPISRKHSKRLIKRILNNSKGVLVRDPVDYQLLLDLGITTAQVTADNVFGAVGHSKIEKILSEYKLSRGDYIVSTACAWFSSENFWNKKDMNFQKEEEELKNSIIKLYEITEKKIVFLPTVMHDYQLGKLLEEKINKPWFLCMSDEYNCREMFEIIANSYLLFGMRMHSIIFAIRSGVPFVASIYDEKVRHLLSRIKMDNYAIELDEINSKIFTEKVIQLINNKEEIKIHLEQQSLELGKLVRTQINKLLNEDSST